MAFVEQSDTLDVPPDMPVARNQIAYKRVVEGEPEWVDNAGGLWHPPAFQPKLKEYAKRVQPGPWFLHKASGWVTTTPLAPAVGAPVLFLEAEQKGLFSPGSLWKWALGGIAIAWLLQPAGERNSSRWAR